MANRVYIIIINYTKYKDTIECLESIFKSSYANLQVLIIDNSPNDISSVNIQKWLNNSYKQIQTSFPDLIYPLIDTPLPYTYIEEESFEQINTAFIEPVILIKAQNRGFAAANNIGLRYVLRNAGDTDYVWLLNNDTVVDKLAIEKLVEFDKTHADKPCFITSKLLSYHHENKIQAIIGRYNKYTGGSYHIGEGEIDHGQYDNYQVTDTDYLVGASIFMGRELLKQVDLMSEEYFLYFEDLDWSRHIVKKGYKLAVQPEARVYHKEGATNTTVTGAVANNDLGGYYTLVNRMKFTIKWYPTCLVTVLSGVIYGLVKRIIQGKFKLVKRVCYAITHPGILVRYMP
jgi:GT2 family glycosyltransferase